MGTGIGGQSVEDMERVIAAMRRVIERLQGENDTLKKQSSKNVSSSEMSRENRQLKVCESYSYFGCVVIQTLGISDKY